MPKRIAILHYASPPVVGGVELTIAHQSRVLTDLGCTVRVISGSGAPFDARVETRIEPLFGSRHPDVLAVKAELDEGRVTPQFDALVDRQYKLLQTALDGCDLCIVHNIPTFNKNLALTAALARLNSLPLLAWCHDLAWTNPQYLPELFEREPYTLLCQRWPNAHYITVSEPRRYELAHLLDVPPDSIIVIPPGIDPATFLHWTDTTRDLEARLHLLDADLVLLLPARLTRRKNIALALSVQSALRQQSGRLDVRLIVTGPPGPHNPSNMGYLGELLTRRDTLGLRDAAHFLYELYDPPLVPDDATMVNLYQLADALFFPSAQEGFGIPLLEAGLVGLPVFCSAIPPFQITGQEDVTYFHPDQDTPDDIAARILSTLQANQSYRLRTRVRHNYRWDRIIRERLLPLLEDA